MWPDEENGVEHPPEDLLDLFLELEEAGLHGEEISDFAEILECCNGVDG